MLARMPELTLAHRAVVIIARRLRAIFGMLPDAVARAEAFRPVRRIRYGEGS